MSSAPLDIDTAVERHGIDRAVLQQYIWLHELPDGRLCGVLRLLFHYTVHIGIVDFSYTSRWCFDSDPVEAVLSLLAYSGEGDMPGAWRKDVSGRRRHDPTTGIIWHEEDPTPTAVVRANRRRK